MLTFIVCLFSTIGLIASVIWLGGLAFEIVVALKERRRQRDKEIGQIIAAINRIEIFLHNKPNPG